MFGSEASRARWSIVDVPPDANSRSGPSQAPTWERSELLLICEALRLNDWQPIRRNDPRAEELSQTLRALPLHPQSDRTATFRSPSSIQRKSFDILTRMPNYTGVKTNGGKQDAEVLRLFLDDPAAASALARAVASVPEDPRVQQISLAEDDDFDEEAPEGRLLYRRHKVYERSRKLRDRRIKAVERAGGKIACEACQFDFAQVYGPAGDGYIQVHHTLPLHASGEGTTRLSDLVLLCANCHAMAHRLRPWPTAAGLRELIQSRAQR
jgi:5-methylcytosine-specific restriction enzyme A